MSTKSRDQLLAEYENLKENSYIRIFKIPMLLLLLLVLNYYFPSIREDKLLIWVIFIAYLVLDLILSFSQTEKN